ncbi:La-type HTH domain [Arabidopsis thaliana x Arabidopsis arenosa]|uniref:La-type HTH domain n=1 Tax=Arabidopsis thaliana x Arabidopsis arenosa TaxID=1240361 RepID=A0A8T1ZQ16_9BRAS|nr:La-type HTH domain [Arabidopsis thaliana x Arabidopsis arenosa]
MANQQTLDSSTPPQSDDPSHSHSSSSSPAPPLSRTFSSSRLNANAPEFVPGRTTPPLPQPRMMIPPPPPPLFLHMYHHPPPPLFHVPITGPIPFLPHERRRRDRKKKDQAETGASVSFDPKSGLPEDTVQKIVNQVEYYFSDLNLATTDLLMRFISKDPQGYVPMHIVASFNKIKSFINSNSQLATVLQNSSKLVVSEDGKRVRRLYPITEAALEELQSRIVVAENLPENHCYQNLMKIFSAVGSVKHIRTSQPQKSGSGPPSAARSAKTDSSNKVHAFVEYERVELAKKAVSRPRLNSVTSPWTM